MRTEPMCIVAVERRDARRYTLVHSGLTKTEAVELYRRYKERNKNRRGVDYRYMDKYEWAEAIETGMVSP